VSSHPRSLAGDEKFGRSWSSDKCGVPAELPPHHAACRRFLESRRFLEEGRTLWFALWEQIAVMTKLQHSKIGRCYQSFFKAGREKIRGNKIG